MFLIIKTLSKLPSGQHSVNFFPGGAFSRTPLEACTFGTRLGNRSVFLLDPRLSGYFWIHHVSAKSSYFFFFTMNIHSRRPDRRKICGFKNIQIRVDGQIQFECGYMWTWKFLNPERKSCTPGARDFPSAVSGFCQVFIVSFAPRGFGLRPKICRPSANTENSRRTREKPLVPRVKKVADSKTSGYVWTTGP